MTDGAVIFDMDGTLVDNMPLHIECWTALFQDEGRTVTVEDYHASGIGGSAEEVARHFLGGHLDDAYIERLVGKKEFLYRTLARRRLKLLRGTRRMLWQARREEIPLALATSAGERNVEFFLETQDLHGYFDAVLDAGSVTRTKPHPDVFLKAADRMGVPPDRCLVFEDSLPGLEAARRAGCGRWPWRPCTRPNSSANCRTSSRWSRTTRAYHCVNCSGERLNGSAAA